MQAVQLQCHVLRFFEVWVQGLWREYAQKRLGIRDFLGEHSLVRGEHLSLELSLEEAAGELGALQSISGIQVR
jgi:hypothetical protein